MNTTPSSGAYGAWFVPMAIAAVAAGIGAGGVGAKTGYDWLMKPEAPIIATPEAAAAWAAEQNRQESALTITDVMIIAVPTVAILAFLLRK